MTWRSRVLLYFPAFHFLVSAIALGGALAVRSLGAALAGAALVYVLPPVVFRLHAHWMPIREGISYLSDKKYSPWWGGHQIQLLFITLPFLEAALRLVPGLYSAWLRAWGSQIGKGVYWTPQVRIEDRSLMEVGDGVIFGHKVECYAHAIKRNRRGILLYTARIKIGAGAFVSAGVRMGPGVVIAPAASVPLLTTLKLRKAFP